MRVLIIVMAVIVLTGCATQAQIDARNARMAEAKNAYYAAASKNTKTCPSKEICDKAFRIAKLAVNETTDMKIQFSDDTIVQTYNPIRYGYCGVEVKRTPSSGSSETITYTTNCKGFGSGYDSANDYERVAAMYELYSAKMDAFLAQNQPEPTPTTPAEVVPAKKSKRKPN